MIPRYMRGTIALAAGILLNILGDQALGVRIEIFSGISTFNLAWAVDVFIVPFIAGFSVAWIFGFGGKWLACLPPLIVRCMSYGYMYYFGKTKGDFFYDLHIFYWGLCVILAVEASNFGGILGEVMKGVYRDKNPSNEKRNLPE